MSSKAQQIIQALGLEKNIEGAYYRRNIGIDPNEGDGAGEHNAPERGLGNVALA